MIEAPHCSHCDEHDRILRGIGLDQPGLVEQVRRLAWLPQEVRKLQGGDVMQGAVIEAVIRIAGAAALVGVTVLVTRLFA